MGPLGCTVHCLTALNKMKNKLKYIAFVCLLAASGLIGACQHGAGKEQDTPTSGTITITADESFKPVIEAEVQVFESIYPTAHIQVKYLPEVDAINALLRDSVHTCIASRPFTAQEKQAFESRQLVPRETPLALDGIAVIVHPSNKDTLLTTQQLGKILRGEITDWSQINGGAKGKIHLVFDNPKSCTVRYAVDSLARTPHLSPALSALEYNLDVVDYVANHPESIGMIGVSWISDSRDPKMLTFYNKIKVVALSKQEKATADNSYKPFQAYLATRKYPLERFIYLLITEPRAGLGTGLSSFMAGDKGQRIIQKTGILPITEPIRLVNVHNE